MSKGVEVRGKSIRIVFYYNGEKRRETLKGLLPTPKNIIYAENLAGTIRHQIGTNDFDYSLFFPDSDYLSELKLQRYIDVWLDIKKATVAPSTFNCYRKWVTGRILPKWGNRLTDKVRHSEIQQWVNTDLSSLTNKSIKEIVSILSSIFKLYARDNNTTYNPCYGIQIKLPDQTDIDPFTQDEIAQIMNTEPRSLGEHNMAIFHLWSGLRVSELLALGWDDIDMIKGKARIRRARVDYQYKVTKTKTSDRTLDLLQPALRVLQSQLVITGDRVATKVSVLQRDNKTFKSERFKPVFVSLAGEAYSSIDSYRESFWAKHLEAAGVRYRGPNNCRHTYASQMLTAGMPLQWILSQTGHNSEQILRQRYARYINEDSPQDMAALANSRLKLD